MTDRDTLAAAALTGLLAVMRDETIDEICESAYEWADAMLRERERTKEKQASFSYTNHDAAPTARVSDSQCAGHAGIGGTTSPPVASTGQINRNAASQSPGVKCGGGEPLDVSQPDNGLAAGGRGHSTQQPVAWAVIPGAVLAGRAWRVTLDKTEAERLSCGKMLVVPLYEQPQPTLTAEEREAIECAVCQCKLGREREAAATLRNLLERTK